MDLSPKKALALCMLLAGRSADEIAEALGISAAGVAKIKREEDFKIALRQAVQEVYSRAIGELASGAIAAAARIKRIVENEKTSDYHAILAARLLFDILETSRRWDLEERLEQVERLLKIQNAGSGDLNGSDSLTTSQN